MLSAAAIALTASIEELDRTAPYLMGFAAITIASWYGGLGPGLLATLVIWLGVDFFVLDPEQSLTIVSGEHALTAVIFVGVAALISSLNAARSRAEETLGSLLVKERDARADVELARRQADEGRMRMEFLSEVSATLAQSLDYDETLRRVARLVVPRLADWCVIHLVGDDGAPRPAAIAHVNPEKVAWAEALQDRYPPDPSDERGVPSVIRSQQPEIFREIPDALIVAAARDEEHLQILRGVGLSSAIVVPMVARGRSLGAISLFAAESGRRYGDDDLALADLLARRCAQAVENATLFRDSQAAEARFRGLFEGTAEAVLVASRNGSFLDANPAATALFGYTADEIRRLQPGELSGWGRDAALSHYNELLARGEWEGEVTMRRKDGAPIHVEGRAREVQLPSGQVYVSTWRDVSDRRQLERLQQEFLATLSHDLKNPLTALKVQTQLLERHVRREAAPDKERLREGLGTLAVTVGRMERLLDELADVTRVRLGQPIQLQIGRTDLVALLRTSVEHHESATDRHTFDVEIGPGRAEGNWDEARLERVLDNVIGNAVKYSPDGGMVSIHLTSERRDNGDWVAVTISDEGVGIPADDLPHISQRFYRASNVLGRFAGSGIGLAGARQIVELHGGTIAIASEEGKGTTVTVELPLAPA